MTYATFSFILSDGDNVQYMQHHMKRNWSNAARGSTPMGWTAQPLATDLDPAMLNYYWSTATTNDCLVAGPSGAGYTRLNFWGPSNLAAYTRASDPYLQRSGMRSITVWSTVSSPMVYAFATNTWSTSSQVRPQVKRRGRSWSRNPEYVSTRQCIGQWLVKAILGKMGWSLPLISRPALAHGCGPETRCNSNTSNLQWQ